MRYLLLIGVFGVFATTSSSEELSLNYWGGITSGEQEKVHAPGVALEFPALRKFKSKENDLNSIMPDGVGDISFGILGLTKDGNVCVDFEGKFDQCGLFLSGHGVRFRLTDKRVDFPIYLGLEVR